MNVFGWLKKNTEIKVGDVYTAKDEERNPMEFVYRRKVVLVTDLYVVTKQCATGFLSSMRKDKFLRICTKL